MYTNIQLVVKPFDNWFDKTAVSCIQPVVKPVAQPGYQLVERTVAVRSTRFSNRVCQTGCTTWFENRLNETAVPSTRLSNPFVNRFDDRLYRAYKHSTGCQTGLTTG